MQQHYFDFEIWRIFGNDSKSSGCSSQYFTLFGDGYFLETRQKDKSRLERNLITRFKILENFWVQGLVC
jgi:hypothetical protein